MNDYAKLESEIEEEIRKLESRILAGETVFEQCRQQLHTLKLKLNDYKKIRNQLISRNVSSAADGDL